MATYGGADSVFPVNYGTTQIQAYTTVDSETGQITVYERKGSLPAVKLGTINATGENKGKFIRESASTDEAKFYNQPNQLKNLKNKALETAIDAQIKSGINPDVAKKRSNELLETGKATTPPNADPETLASDALRSLQDLKVPKKSGTRSGSGSFGDHRYPLDMASNQDVIQFKMLEYKAKDIVPEGQFGFGNRSRVGLNGGTEGRTILGSVTLPIPGGIKDTNILDWGDDKLNALEIAAAATGLAMFEGAGTTEKTLEKISNTLGQNSEEAKTAIKGAFVGKAVGVQGLLKRTTGLTINPNLELLFNGPSLRPFNFNFRLSARSKSEAQEIIKIIRFFKQGMAPIRSESNLFLLAPNTFQVNYILRGKEHPYIGKMKECALIGFDTDYTPEQNYSTFEDGFMTSYSITLQLKELEPVFSDDYENDGDQSIGY